MASELDKISECIENKKNFVLNGGAGSGKTYTLGKVLDKIYNANPSIKVVCITYTNVAKDEIIERFGSYGILACTYHEFLWSQIKNFQNDIKKRILSLVASEDIKYKRDEDKPELTEELYREIKINYEDYKRLEKGIISHEDVLILAEKMFESYPLLSRIVSDRFDYIFIDEYQDTSPLVIKIFLEHLQKYERRPVIGLFGDPMQAIYATGVGDVTKHIISGCLNEIKKSDNYRSTQIIVDVLNNLRADIQQESRLDSGNDDSNAMFLYSREEKNSEQILNSLSLDTNNTKTLYLTHNLISNEMGFVNIFKVYIKGRSSNTDPKPLDYALKIVDIIDLYSSKKYVKFINKTKYTISKVSDKADLKKHVEYLLSEELLIGQFIEYAKNNGLINEDEKVVDYIESTEDRLRKYEEFKEVSVQELFAYSKYKNKYSPFSTQHGVKGAEFDNVLVVLDNGKWNLYNFKYLFEDVAGKEETVKRTEKIFYVSCSRAKKNLYVYYQNPSLAVLETAGKWFKDVQEI